MTSTICTAAGSARASAARLDLGRSLRAALRRWTEAAERRRSSRALVELDERMLADIGLERIDLRFGHRFRRD
jgi:uncharacterized protein YjiS (DUF1127 family)